MDPQSKREECLLSYEYQYDRHQGQAVHDVVRELVDTCGTKTCFEHISPVPLPNPEVMVVVIKNADRQSPRL